MRYHPGNGTWASSAASYGCRARAGLPPAVCRPVCRASPPDHAAAGPQMDGVRIHPAPRWHQNRMLSSLAAAALQRRLAPRHYRTAAAVLCAAQRQCDVVQQPAVVTGCRGAIKAIAIGRRKPHKVLPATAAFRQIHTMQLSANRIAAGAHFHRGSAPPDPQHGVSSGEDPSVDRITLTFSKEVATIDLTKSTNHGSA